MSKFYSFTTPKKGSSAKENDDKRFFLNVEGKSRARFAIADGATESSFSSDWADLLVKDYVRKGFKSGGGLANRIKALSKKWSQNTTGENLPWYAQEKAKMGAFSTLLGFEIESIRIRPMLMEIKETSTDKHTWLSIALGDSCLFQVRKNKLIRSFPFKKSSEFNNTPVLISSNRERNSTIVPSVKTASGSWKPGDEFFISTDAFAAWFLKETENQKRPWVEFHKIIRYVNCQKKFESWVSSKRESGGMKNDDTTVIFIKL